MRILVTGGSGFLGLALADALARRGAEVVAADLTPPPAPWQAALAPQVARHPLDVTDRAAVGALMAAAAPDVVVHAAAATPDAGREAAGDAAAVVAVNVGGTATVVEAAAGVGARVLALSSIAVYGRTLADCDRLDEDMPPRPQTLYAITKAAAEALALRLGAIHGVAVCAPRVGILWGAFERRTDARATPSPPFAMFEAARAGRDVILPAPATAPLLHVDAAVAALAALIEADVRGPVNLGGPGSVDLLAFAQAVARRHGVAARVDAGAANVALFAADRPPMDNGRLRAATGHVVPPHDPAAIDRHADWLDAHPLPAG